MKQSIKQLNHKLDTSMAVASPRPPWPRQRRHPLRPPLPPHLLHLPHGHLPPTLKIFLKIIQNRIARSLYREVGRTQFGVRPGSVTREWIIG